MDSKPQKLVDQLFDKCRTMGRSYKTAEAYWGWCERFLRFHCQKRGGRPTDWVHPKDMREADVEVFLTHLATSLNVSPSTQNQALQGILFMYRNVLRIELKNINAMRAKKPSFEPVVLSTKEVIALLDKLKGRNRLIAYLCYGAGMRIGEVFSLRCKDIDWENRFIHVRQAKGHKDRIVQLPIAAVQPLKEQLAETERLHAKDTQAKRARVPLPYAFAKRSPRSASELNWYFLFSSPNYLDDNKRQLFGRWHLDPTTFTKPLADAVRAAGIRKAPVGAHTLRHSFCTHMMNNHVPDREIQELMGHRSLETTQRYMHVRQDGAASNRSPLDSLLA